MILLLWILILVFAITLIYISKISSARKKVIESLNKSIVAKDNLILANENLIKSLRNVNTTGEKYKNILENFTTDIAKYCLKIRIESLESNFPGLAPSGEFYFKLDDLRHDFETNKINVMEYFVTVDEMITQVINSYIKANNN